MLGNHCVRCNAYMLQVYRVPEMATVLLPGGVNFAELSAEAAEKFQVMRTDVGCPRSRSRLNHRSVYGQI